MGRGRPHRPENESESLIPQPKEQRCPSQNGQGAAVLTAPREHRPEDNPWSLFEIGGHLLLELGERGGATQLLAIDEEGWRGLDVELVRGALTHVLNAIKDLLILQTLIEACLAETGLLADGHERL